MPCRVTRGLFLARGVRLGVTLVMRTSPLVRGLFFVDLGPLGAPVRDNLLLVRPLTLTETYNPEEADPVPAGAVRLILPSEMRRFRVLGDSLDTFECTLSVMLADLRGDFLLGVVLADTLVAVLVATVTVALAVDLAAILGDTLAVVMAVDLAAVLGETLAVVLAIDFGETLAVVLADSLLAMLAATVTVALAAGLVATLGVVLATTFFASPSLASVACSLSWDTAALELARRRRTTRSLASSLPAVESFAMDSL